MRSLKAIVVGITFAVVMFWGMGQAMAQTYDPAYTVGNGDPCAYYVDTRFATEQELDSYIQEGWYRAIPGMDSLFPPVEEGSFICNSLQDQHRGMPGYLQAEDGSWFYYPVGN
jgi:hypothetical protein